MIEQEDDLCCRWSVEYFPATDSMLTRFTAIVSRERLPEPRDYHFRPEYRAFALTYHREQIEEVKRLARENPGRWYYCVWHITTLDIIMPSTMTYASLSSAEAKSLELLKSWLDEVQLVEYSKYKHFVVSGSDTGTRYRLISEHNYNIRELDANGEPTGQKFCVVPIGHLTLGDQLLAQKIWLETDELRTLKLANKIVRGAAVADVCREAVRLFQDSNVFIRNLDNQFREEFAQDARIGSQVRIRLPADYVVRDENDEESAE